MPTARCHPTAPDESDDPCDHARPPTMLLSRVAEHVYWAGRYLERAEATARLVRIHTELFLDLPRSAGLGWTPLLAVTGSRRGLRDGCDRRRRGRRSSPSSLADPEHHGSVVAVDRPGPREPPRHPGPAPPRSWEVVNELHQLGHGRPATAAAPAAPACMWTEDVIRRCHTGQRARSTRR